MDDIRDRADCSAFSECANLTLATSLSVAKKFLSMVIANLGLQGFSPDRESWRSNPTHFNR